MPLFSARILLQDLAISAELLYDGNERLSQFTYVHRMLTLNKPALLMLHNLEQLVLGMFPLVPHKATTHPDACVFPVYRISPFCNRGHCETLGSYLLTSR